MGDFTADHFDSEETTMKTVTGLLTMLMLALAVPSAADQPAMESALDSLAHAKEKLEHATPDKGGHRVEAIRLIDQAMSQVKEGIEYDRTHPGEARN